MGALNKDIDALEARILDLNRNLDASAGAESKISFL